MRKLALLMFVAGAASAQSPADSDTFGQKNCRWWNWMTADQQIGYVIGFVDGYAYLPERTTLSVDGASVGEAVDGVSKICRAPENGRIPIAYAIQIFGMQFKGESAADIAAAAEWFRRLAAIKKGGR